MDYIKKNKKKVLIIAGVVLILILLLIFIKSFLPSSSRSSWGNRLDGIAEHKIEDSSIETIKNSIVGTGKASNVTYRLSGRTMNFIITSTTDRKSAQELTSYILDNIKSDDQSYYDIEVMFAKENDELYPFIGYKHKTSSEFSYSYAGGE